MLEVTLEDYFVLEEDIFLQKIEELGKYWVFNIDSGEHYTLNESSYWILEQVAQNLSTEDILSNFLNVFDVDSKEGKSDFYETLSNFLKEGIITRREDYEREKEKGL